MPGETGSTRTKQLHPSPPAKPAEPSYYDISMLKAPLWKWEIASYFFLGGLSGGAYLLARMADRFGGREYRDLARVGTFVSAAALAACPPLLIHDLGDRSRFHHMLRMFKPSTPMSLGTWVLTSFSGAAGAAVLREWARGRGKGEQDALDKIAAGLRKADRAVITVTDLAGVPLALLLIGYTGVLLSCSANPLWTGNPWLGALFSASAISTGAAATSLGLELAGSDPRGSSAAALEKIDSAAHVAEAITLAGYLHRAGPLADPLTRGKMKKHLWGAAAGILAAEVLKYLPLTGAARRWSRRLAALIGLGAGFSLRWAFVYGGHDSANDPHAARLASGSGGPRTVEGTLGATVEGRSEVEEAGPAKATGARTAGEPTRAAPLPS